MEDHKDIPKTTNYKVPDDYFIDFQERLQVQIEFEEMVGPNRDAGFTVPEGYFSNFSEKLVQQTQQPTKVVSLFKSKWMYAAASVAAIIILLFALSPSNTLNTFDSLENDTIAAYLETDHSFLSAYDLGELLTDEELDNLSNTIQLEDAEVLEYLDITTDQYDLMTQ
ncbi:MAG: hypothetical protein ACI9Y7_000397 [Dokdonia sp.]|jgi:hypothetical protein